MIDVDTFIGPYPFRHLPHPDPDVLARVLEREEVDGAWVGHLPSAFHRDPLAGNEALYAALSPHERALRPVPAVRPDWPKWERVLVEARERGAPAVRTYPPQWGLGPHHAALAELAAAAAEARLPVVLTTRFEDLRQRHWMDTAGDLPGATVRTMARANPDVRLIVTAAGRALVEEVHWGLTPAERARVWWDIAWIWGPPEDELAHLLRTIGADRFVYGSMWPLRLAQTPRANLELLPDDLLGSRLAEVATIGRPLGAGVPARG